MPKMNVSKSIVIDKSLEEVYAQLSDFTKWEQWSPWNILEKGVKINYSDNNKFYEWVGDITGSGNMRIIKENPNESIYIDLTFLKPFKSKAKVDFQLTKTGDSTRVTWNMQSSIPFFLFFMVKAMTIYIGMDFHRGLLLLKDVLEKGSSNCVLEFPGEQQFAGCSYIGVQRKLVDLSRAPEAMKTDFETLMNFTKGKENLINGNPMCIYNDWNLVKNTGDYIATLPVSAIPSNLPTGFVSGIIPASNVYAVRMIGEYHHLGNPWTAIEMLARAKKFKKSKTGKPMEIYFNNPMDTNPKDLITEIQYPVR